MAKRVKIQDPSAISIGYEIQFDIAQIIPYFYITEKEQENGQNTNV